MRIYPTVVIRDTELEAMWRRGEYTPMSPEHAARLGGELLEVFEQSKIPVIRFGLNPTDELSGGEALTGAYHPALGEMARSGLFLKKARKLLEGKETSGTAVLGVNPSCVSIMAGHGGRNRELLMNRNSD